MRAAPTPTSPSPAASRAAAIASARPEVTNVVSGVSARGHPSGTSAVSTKTGAPSGCPPFQPPATSKNRRPATIAPVQATSSRRCPALASVVRHAQPSRAVGTATSPPESRAQGPSPYQPNSSPTPSSGSAT
ncbi:unannotated protein [freshwater metagenome]|uniref:Unannotated protein n=1 Tax=freshwater metagenome TaxID=449393 RepID=A0A6J7JKC2_9ZZZZ